MVWIASFAWIGMADVTCAILFQQTVTVACLFKSVLVATPAALILSRLFLAEERRWRDRERIFRDRAMRDPLTGLANRHAFTRHLDATLSCAQRTDSCVGVMFVDLDGFKSINDRSGHLFGDAVLCAVASRLGYALRDTDLVARFGGDEFAVVVAADTPEDVERLAHRLSDAFQHPFDIDGRACPVSASIGFACFPDQGADIETLISAADAAMYGVKKQGGCGIAACGPSFSRASGIPK